MGKLYMKADPKALVNSELFSEATKDELKVFLVASAFKGALSLDELAIKAGCSLPRCKAAIALFSEAGILECSEGPFEDEIIEYEHGEESSFSDTDDLSPKETAREIKRQDMSPLLDECAAILDKAALSSTEAAKIVTLVTTLSLSGEYLTTLLSFLKSKKCATVTRLVRKAEELVSKGIDDFDALNEYIKEQELPGYIFEYRRVLGIYGRAVSPTEKSLYKKWAEEYLYSVEILALAYDVAVTAGAGASINYIDTVLSGWHSAGCKTVKECEENRRAFKDAREAEKKEHSEKPKRKSKTEPPALRYGDFDVDEAFKLALSRSYGENDD